MIINLYNPPVHHYAGYHYNSLPIYGLAVLACVLNDAGHDTTVYDLEASKSTPRMLIDKSYPYIDVIGFTCLTVAAPSVKNQIASLRFGDYNGRIVVGGVHPTVRPEEVLAWGADLVVTGECEGNIVELLEGGAAGIHKGEPMPIEDIPLPDWDNYYPDITTYRGNHEYLRPNPGVSMWTRGCPYSCIYCANQVFYKQPTRYRPPINITDEMLQLWSRGINNVYVYDDELIGTKLPDGWMAEIADRIGDLEFNWMTQARCSWKHISLELLQNMKRAGCSLIMWGVESFSQNVLDAIEKHTTPDDIWYSLEMAKEAGIKNGVFTMIGNYKESEEDLQITANALKKAYDKGLIDYRQTFVTHTLPGTELERVSKEEGWYEPAKLGGVRQKRVPDNGTPWLSPQEITEWLQVYKQVCPAPAP